MTKRIRKSLELVLGMLILLSLMLAACAQASEPTSSAGGVAASTESSASAPQATTAPQTVKEGLSIGLLDGTNDNGWRILMEQQMQELADQYKTQGIVSKYTAYSANNDATVQAQQMEQLINAGTDIILINPVSTTALNPAIDKAVEKGIIVIAVDQTIDHPNVISVTTDQRAWARKNIDYLVKALNGKGDILVFNAIAGAPANEERKEVFNQVLAENPGIHVLKEVNHDWDVGKAKQLMTQLLPAYPNFDGILTQECSPGIMQALIDAGHPMPKVITSDETVLYLRMWQKWNQEHPDNILNGILVENPPGIGADGMKIAVRLAQGKQLKADVMTSNSVLLEPHVTITNDNLDEWVNKTKDMADTDTISSVMSDEQIDALFQ